MLLAEMYKSFNNISESTFEYFLQQGKRKM